MTRQFFSNKRSVMSELTQETKALAAKYHIITYRYAREEIDPRYVPITEVIDFLSKFNDKEQLRLNCYSDEYSGSSELYVEYPVELTEEQVSKAVQHRLNLIKQVEKQKAHALLS